MEKKKYQSKTVDISNFLREEFQEKFKITQEKSFPFDGTTYRPDLVFQDKVNDNIKAIIEIEGGPRKHMVGGVITADYVMGKEKQRPSMFVIALNELDRKDYQKRIAMLEHYTTNFKEFDINDLEHIISRLKEIH
jgi:hypothetical protein